MITEALEKISDGLGKIDEGLRNSRDKEFSKFQKKMRKQTLAPYCSFARFDYNEKAENYFIITDKEGNTKYTSSSNQYCDHFSLYDQNKKQVGSIRIKHRFLKSDAKIINIPGLGKCTFSSKFKLGGRTFTIARNHNTTQVSDEAGSTIARIIRHGLRYYLIEYTDSKDELISVFICMSDKVYDDRRVICSE